MRNSRKTVQSLKIARTKMNQPNILYLDREKTVRFERFSAAGRLKVFLKPEKPKLHWPNIQKDQKQKTFTVTCKKMKQ